MSYIGEISLDSSGQVTLNSVVAVLAGGISEARRFLKKAIKNENFYGTYFVILGGFCMSVAGLLAFLDYRKTKKRNILSELDRKVFKIPTEKARAMGTFCCICLSQPVNVIFEICNHASCCFECWK